MRGKRRKERMILKNAPIVILDEATAFTDPENEDKIQRSIAALTKGKTLQTYTFNTESMQQKAVDVFERALNA